MAMKRKRRLVEQREPNGRIQREPEFPPTQVRRLRDAAMRGLRDPEWGTELGRLFLEGTITSAMYAAGKRFAELASQYQAVIGAFPVRSAAAEPASRSQPPDPESDEGKQIAKREADRIERFLEVRAILVDEGASQVVRALLEENRSPCGMMEMIKLRTGLLRLAAHWGLTSERKSENGVR